MRIERHVTIAASIGWVWELVAEPHLVDWSRRRPQRVRRARRARRGAPQAAEDNAGGWEHELNELKQRAENLTSDS